MTTQDAPLSDARAKLVNDLTMGYVSRPDGGGRSWDENEAAAVRLVATFEDRLRAALAPSLDTPVPREVKVAEVRIWDPARRALRIVCRCGKEILGSNWARHLATSGNHGLQYATPLPRDTAVQRLVEAARAYLDAEVEPASSWVACWDRKTQTRTELREALRHLEQEAGG